MRSFSLMEIGHSEHHSLLSPAPANNAQVRQGIPARLLRLPKPRSDRSAEGRRCGGEPRPGGSPGRPRPGMPARSASARRPALWSRAVRPARVRQTVLPKTHGPDAAALLAEAAAPGAVQPDLCRGVGTVASSSLGRCSTKVLRIPSSRTRGTRKQVGPAGACPRIRNMSLILVDPGSSW